MESIFSKLDLHKPQLLDTTLCSILAYMVTLNSTMEATLDPIFTWHEVRAYWFISKRFDQYS